MTEAFAFARLLSSRICHDLISPVGAIGNGLELIRGAEGEIREEVDLIAESAEAAADALRFLRLAFGARGAEETASTADLASALDARYRRRRIVFDWGAAPPELPFTTAQPLLWLAMITASALPRGGAATLTRWNSQPFDLEWRLSGDVGPSDALLAVLGEAPQINEVAPGDAHILMLWIAGQAEGSRPFWRAPDAVGLA